MRGTAERHFRTVHKNEDTDFPPAKKIILKEAIKKWEQTVNMFSYLSTANARGYRFGSVLAKSQFLSKNDGVFLDSFWSEARGFYVDFSSSLFQVQLTLPSMMLMAVTCPRMTFCKKLRW